MRTIFRHFAYFDQETGECLREVNGQVPAPNISHLLIGDARVQALNAWATEVSKPEPNEIALDVTGQYRLLGDFRWAHFDSTDRVLTLNDVHSMVELDLSLQRVVSTLMSGRPARSHDRRVLFDVTGTPLDPQLGPVYSQLLLFDAPTTPEIVGVIERVPVMK